MFVQQQSTAAAGERIVVKAGPWTWRMSVPMPWGKPLAHAVEPRQLLSLPLAYTQDSLLTPDDFAKRARERGVDIRPEYLLELHRQRALVPLLRILQRPPKSSTVVPVAASAAGGYGHFRSPLALVVAAATEGLLVDPATGPYRAWDGGLPLPTHGRVHRYPSVFYSQYQLLALRPTEQLIRTMSGSRAADGKVTMSLESLTPDEIDALNGGRQLAILLSGAFDFDARRAASTVLNASSDVDGPSRMPVNLWVSLRTVEIRSPASRRVYEVDERQGLGRARPVDERQDRIDSRGFAKYARARHLSLPCLNWLR
jgi:hypothetical protein